MKNEKGERIVSCDIAANCSTCMYYRNWLNCSRLHEGDADFCDYPFAIVEKE